MKHLIVLFSTCLLLCTAACTHTDDMETVHEQRQMTFTASGICYTPLVQTRTEVGGVNPNGALNIEWSTGDSIGVFGTTVTNIPFVNSNSATSATFTGTMDGIPLYAYYPYKEDAIDATAIAVEIPQEQMYTDESSIAQCDIKAATVEVQGHGYALRFRQLASLVRFEIDLSNVKDLADDELLLSITVRPSVEAAPMTGNFTYSLTDLDAGLRPGSTTNDGITVRFALPPTAREKAIAYAVVAPGIHSGEKWFCEFTTDRQVGTFTTTVLCDFKAGKYYTVPLNAEILASNDATYEPALEEETANCYIVTGPGEYNFKATVIGNGEKGIIPNAGFHTESPYINPKSAKLLWSEHQNFITDVRLENGRVYYTVGDSYSNNAVIAVYSDPDCQGEILWSWHIWGTIGMPKDEEYTNQTGAKFQVMDRELGAVRVGQDAMLYQWGRKDPFPHNNSFTRYWNGTEYVTVSTLKGWTTIAIDNATIADAVRHPMELLHGTSATQTNWLGSANFHLWGDADRTLPDNLGNPSAGAGWNQQKTVYDPSPVGYRVASIFTFSGFTTCPNGTNKDMETGRLDCLNYVKATEGTNTWYFQKDIADTEGVPYDAIRSRDGFYGYQKKSAGEGGYWWSAEAYAGNEGKTYACYLNTDEYRQGSSSTKCNNITTYGRTNLLRDAYAVRCVREKSVTNAE